MAIGIRRPDPGPTTAGCASNANRLRSPLRAPARAALRAIAVFEATKGVAALAALFGWLALMHHDVHRLALEWIGHFGLDPHSSCAGDCGNVMGSTALPRELRDCGTIEKLPGGDHGSDGFRCVPDRQGRRPGRRAAHDDVA